MLLKIYFFPSVIKFEQRMLSKTNDVSFNLLFQYLFIYLLTLQSQPTDSATDRPIDSGIDEASDVFCVSDGTFYLYDNSWSQLDIYRC